MPVGTGVGIGIGTEVLVDESDLEADTDKHGPSLRAKASPGFARHSQRTCALLIRVYSAARPAMAN